MILYSGHLNNKGLPDVPAILTSAVTAAEVFYKRNIKNVPSDYPRGHSLTSGIYVPSGKKTGSFSRGESTASGERNASELISLRVYMLIVFLSIKI